MYRPHNYHHMYDLCEKHIHAYVLIQLNDGNSIDGIITGLDEEYVYMAVPNFGNQRDEERISPIGFPGYGFGYGYGPYPYPPVAYPGARFRRLVLPLAALTALSALPWY
ncbi:hypothetical protein [Aquibacillus rhizosphaerae]|uniref:LSM domain-containing protein n=1 Tax=Aquibacillus rhizosphaerae TaxID=3051431 RepID=A0ABT7LAL5_9BACI|nr:hypothetical protein [Aquibacillus sp. LR5S19]MDL4842911.1 hypothetical protein [Aquibacillus sp. LR5S19]